MNREKISAKKTNICLERKLSKKVQSLIFKGLKQALINIVSEFANDVLSNRSLGWISIILSHVQKNILASHFKKLRKLRIWILITLLPTVKKKIRNTGNL